MNYVFAMVLLLCSFNSRAAIYEQNNNTGIIYSDTPASNAQPVALPNNNDSVSFPPSTAAPSDNRPSATAPSLPSLVSGATTGKKLAHVPYTSFQMLSPTDQQTFQNQQDIPAIIKTEPSLQEGDTIQLLLDGNPIGSPTSNLSELGIHQVDRGEHTLSAALHDAAGHLLSKVGPVTIFIHYSAIPTGSGAVSGGAAGQRAPGMPAAPPASNAPATTNAPATSYAPAQAATPNAAAAPNLPAAP